MDAPDRQNEPEVEIEAAEPNGRARAPATSRLDVTGTQVCASTLASVSAAAVASIFGVAGTITGAALVSVVATVGSALYSHGIRQTGAKLQQTQAVQPTRLVDMWQRLAPTREPGSSDIGDAPDAADAATNSSARQALETNDPTPGWKERLSRRRWGLALGVATVFVASLAAVTLVELVGQQPLASISGNEPSGSTSIGSVLRTGRRDTPDDVTTTSTTSAGPSEAGTPSDEPGTSTTSNSESPGSSSTTIEEEEPTTTDPPSDPVTTGDTTTG